jgi:drug/metabolite transporter (DMT)-like permease
LQKPEINHQMNLKIPANKGFIHIKLHFIVIILGFSAVLGKLISIDAVGLVFFRTLTGIISMILFAVLVKNHSMFNRKALIAGSWIGLLLAAHWITFFHAIKVSNVSVTLGCLGTSTLFAAFLEPLTDRKKISPVDVLAGLVIIAGIYMIFRFEFRYVEGIIYSVISALLAAIFSVFNKHLSLKHDFRAVALSELIVACVASCIFIFAINRTPVDYFSMLKPDDILWIVILGSVGTAYAYTATISVIQKLNAYAVVLAINLEPVYGILLARWIFGESEMMTPGFYVGASVILMTVIMYSIKNKFKKGQTATI